jgi:GrpB-like predicted nucleotidyltransferase (UPF0157 family)
MGVTVVLAEYDPGRAELYAREAARIRGALGERALLVEHAGSTAVPGLAAKPVIDIVLAVADSAAETEYARDLEAAGYALTIREPEWLEHRMFTMPGVNLHVFSDGCSEIGRMLAFRDWLRENVDDRTLYERTKRELAGLEWAGVQEYADAKTAVVEEIMRRISRP